MCETEGKKGLKGLDLGLNAGTNARQVYNGCHGDVVGPCKCVSDMGDLLLGTLLEVRETCGTGGKLGESRVHGGREWDHGPISRSGTLGS